MANENQNTGPNLGGKGTPDPQALRQSLKQLLDDQGDYNNLLKNAISDLKKMDTAYSKIEARLSSLNKDSVNIKQVNQELLRLRQKEFLEGKKLRDLESEASQVTKDALATAKQRTQQLMKDAAILGEQVDYEETMLAYLKDTGDLEAVVLYTQEKQLEIAKKQTEQGLETLSIEKQLNKQIGFTGAAFKLFSDKLGVGTEFYSEMVSKARQLQSEGKKITFLDKLSILGGSIKAGIKETFSDPLAFFSALPIAGAAIGGIVKGIKSILDYILGIQDQTVKFARAMNLSTGEARKLKMEFADLSISSGDLFITSQKMVESQMELTDALGITNRLSNSILDTNIKLKDITGLDLETRKELAVVSSITNQDATKAVLAQVVGLKQATGVSFQYQKILKEASSQGGYLGLSFAKYPAQLTKSLLTVKAMGLELKQLDSIADSFLDFESSISKEFEAQLLTGKDINLTKAREAFLNNDLATAAQEITSQVGSAGDFLKLNRIQAESLASAFGMSRDQMAEMLKQQELLTALGAKQGDSAQKQLQLGLQRYQSQKALAAAVGEEAYQSLINASAQEKIAAFIDKIKQSFADFVEKSGVIGVIEKFINFLSKPENIKSVLETLRNFFADAVEAVLSIANGVINAIDFITLGFGIDEEFERKFEKFSEQAPKRIRSLGTGGMEGVSIGENIAAANVNSAAPVVNNMSMARPGGEPKVYVMVMVDPVTGRSVEKVVSQEYYETHFGQMGKQ